MYRKMPERTEIEKYVRWMIASDILYRTLKGLGEKGIRRLDKTAKSISELLRSKEEVGDRIEVKIEELEEEMKARTINEGIEEFSKKYPEYGIELKKLIDETRKDRNRYLVYRLKKGFKLGEEDYLQVMMDLDFDRREASSVYPHVLSYSQRKKKAEENRERKILLKEQKKRAKKK
jgi:hypothetical protein